MNLVNLMLVFVGNTKLHTNGTNIIILPINITHFYSNKILFGITEISQIKVLTENKILKKTTP